MQFDRMISQKQRVCLDKFSGIASRIVVCVVNGSDGQPWTPAQIQSRVRSMGVFLNGTPWNTMIDVRVLTTYDAFLWPNGWLPPHHKIGTLRYTTGTMNLPPDKDVVLGSLNLSRIDSCELEIQFDQAYDAELVVLVEQRALYMKLQRCV